MSNSQKTEHLEFVSRAIDRMANNSFLLKGWCLTLLAALFVLAGDNELDLKWVPVGVIVGFFVIDTYYLYNEKLFRNLYDEVRNAEEIDFSMTLKGSNKDIWSAVFSIPSAFYLFLMLVVLAISNLF